MIAEAFDGETLLALDEMPDDAEMPEVLEVIDDVHAESVAAVMTMAPGRYVSPRRWNPDYPPRPFSGPASETRPGRAPRGWS